MKGKREARILASKCFSGKCIGIILRGPEVDGAVSGRGCAALCRDVEERGFSGELRFAAGDCRCGYPPPPTVNRSLEGILYTLSSSLPLWIQRVETILSRKI
ncbi:MAG: hypothetical protein GSR73_06480 [Desulfurococcales archaeon]|nr:hypothetical protein [Desulfurococcales archaeon]